MVNGGGRNREGISVSGQRPALCPWRFVRRMNGVSVLESVSVELVARIISKHLALTSDRIGRQTLITRVIEIQSQVQY